MKVLWFEISVPGRYKDEGVPTGGWQDSLEGIVRNSDKIELSIAFQGSKHMTFRRIDGVDYYPLIPKVSYLEKKIKWRYNRWAEVNAMIPLAMDCIEKVKPDVIHIFGTEWEFGQVAKYTDIPCVIHMQGCLAPYFNALYPPSYSSLDPIVQAGINIKKQFHLWQKRHYIKTEQEMEKDNFAAVTNYMGRTEWDKGLVELYHPGAKYYYCSEVLRPVFMKSAKWHLQKNQNVKLVTVGCGNHWKGMDTVIRTANLLKERGFEFEWFVAGKMYLQKEIEKKEKMFFSDLNVHVLGFVDANQVKELLLSSDIYVHTAYIDNSPNAICEAQYIGMPIIATYVGGIPSLIDNHKDGLLVPANAPHTLAYEIMSLSKDYDRMEAYSKSSIIHAEERHNPETIFKDLLHCYKDIQK